MRYFFIFFLISVVAVSMATAQDTLYSETFANGSAENTWYPGYAGNNMDIEFLTGNPSGDNWVGKLGNDLSGGGVGQSFSGDPQLDDFYMEAQVFIPVDQGTYYGIEFRIDSVGNSSGYQFLARFNPSGMLTPRLRFRYRPGAGFPVVIRDWESAEIPGGVPSTSGWHKLAVRAVGNQFWLYYDDQELPGCPYTDATAASGFIGAYVWDQVLSPIYLYIDDILVKTIASNIDDPVTTLSTDYDLEQNFPNPFNPTTQIGFRIPQSETVQLTVFNSLGQKVRTLFNGALPAGGHTFRWNARNDLGLEVPAGIYYYHLQAGEYQAARSMLLLK
ncbi:MAG: FlgD immunoglobulin-like domain containing protein [Calditrichia bacterium]